MCLLLTLQPFTLWSLSITTDWVSQGRATIHPTGCWIVCCRLRSMFPLFSNNTKLTLDLTDLSIKIPSCANSKSLRKVLTCRLVNIHRHFEGRTWLCLQGQTGSSLGTNTLMVRTKKDHCRGEAVQELYCLTLNMNAVHSSETSAKIS
jgi:hypothetical protein